MTPVQISLRNGLVMRSPLDPIVEFVTSDGTDDSYDRFSPVPCELNPLDVRLANGMIARMATDVSTLILARRGEVATALQPVLTDATLTVPADRVDWDPLYGPYQALSGLAAVGVARMTKLLHRKRPAPVPILDGIVRSYLCDVEPLDLTGDAAGQAFTLTEAYRRELHHQLAELRTHAEFDWALRV